MNCFSPSPTPLLHLFSLPCLAVFFLAILVLLEILIYGISYLVNRNKTVNNNTNTPLLCPNSILHTNSIVFFVCTVVILENKINKIKDNPNIIKTDEGNRGATQRQKILEVVVDSGKLALGIKLKVQNNCYHKAKTGALKFQS